MGIIKFISNLLQGKRSQKYPPPFPSVALQQQQQQQMQYIELESYSSKSRSASSEYECIWQDGNESNNRWISGIVQLKQGGKIVWQVPIERPEKCRVANNGIVICDDSTKKSITNAINISSLFWVIAPNGVVLSKQKLSAYIGSTFKISPNGDIAIFETLPSTRNGYEWLHIYDIERLQVIKKFQINERIKQIKFDETAKKVTVEFDGSKPKHVLY